MMLIAMFIVLFAVCFLGFIYLTDSVKGRLAEVTAALGGVDGGQQKKLYAIRKEVRDSQEARVLLHKLSIKEREIPQFLNDLEALGSQQTPVVVSAVNINTEASTLRVVLAFSGSLGATAKAFEKIIDVEYAAYVESYEVRVGHGNGDDAEEWEASMAIELPLIAKGR